MRRLIVNADDFGESPAVNTAIIRAHDEGIVTSASLMVTGAGFEEAVALAQTRPALGLGLHLVLLSGHSALPPDEIPVLVDAGGRFPENPLSAGIRWAFNPVARHQLRREIEAQLARFGQSGRIPDHLNSHRHFHVHPMIFRLLCEVAQAHGIGTIRLPVEPWLFSWKLERRNLRQQTLFTLAFGALGLYLRTRLPPTMRRIDGVFGLLQTGHIDETYLIRLLRNLPEGTYELYVHPRLDTEQGRRELAALTSARVRQIINESQIDLITFAQV